MLIRPITRDDLPRVCAIAFQAFKQDELLTWLYPNQDKYPDDLRRFQVLRLRSRLVSSGQLGFVVATEEGDAGWSGKEEVVGFAFFLRCGGDEQAKKWREDSWFKSTWFA